MQTKTSILILFETNRRFMDGTAAFYSQPSYGGGIQVFAGSRRQRGGVSLARIALPLAKKVGTSLMKKGARQAMSLAQDVAADVAAGKNIGQSLKEKGMSHLQQFGKRALKTGIRD